MNTKTQSKHMPGVFAMLAEFRSYEIQSWLDTTSPNVARSLFETGKKIEEQNTYLLRQRDELLEALKAMMAGPRNTFDPNSNEHCLRVPGIFIEQARAAIANAEKGVEK